MLESEVGSEQSRKAAMLPVYDTFGGETTQSMCNYALDVEQNLKQREF